ncbi:MAG: NADPH-dependent oxidoreductase [Hyphomicrobiales bacterium]|nr:NADPH-dependent oxidoreductase [Hyphomicrobiales bacterium]
MLEHRSVRAYKSDALPDGALERIVAAAQSAATSSNMQTWSVVAVADPERKARLAKIAGNQKHILQCPVLLVWIADHSRIRALGESAGAPVEGLDYFESFLVAAVDTALAAQNAVVAAESLGLGAVYIGALRNNPEAVAAELALPRGAAAMFGLCLGYADPAGASDVKPRLPQTSVFHCEQYDPGRTTSEALAAYDADMQAFQSEQGMAPAPWTTTALARFRNAQSLNGRDRLKAAFRALGFAMK